jgi:hypothetical protein
MQLRLSIATSCLLLATTLSAQDYISVQYLHYDEDTQTTKINTPTIEFNKDFGADYTLNITGTHDGISGASPTYYDALSGASATIPKGVLYKNDIRYGDIPYSDNRNSTGFSLTKRLKSRDELTFGYNYSHERDYISNELSFNMLHYLNKSKNTSLSFGLAYEKDKIDSYCFMGLAECDGVSGASSKTIKNHSHTINSEFGITQILDKTSLVKASIFTIKESGYLSSPYQRVVRYYNTSPKITQEQKPNSRFAYGLVIEYDKTFNDKFSSLFSYRFYHDDWGITSHTQRGKFYYDLTNKFTLGLDLRYYSQSKAKFFSGMRDYFTNQKYASSDRHIGKITSYNVAIEADYKLSNSITLNVGAGYYKQVDYFDSKYYNVGFKYSF